MLPVHEELALGAQGRADGFERAGLAFGVAAVEHADPDRHGKVEGGLAGKKREALDGALAKGEAAGGDFLGAGGGGLLDRRRGAVEAEDEGPLGDHRSRQGAGTAANLEHAHSVAERERVELCRETG